jgi:hypothetical protein
VNVVNDVLISLRADARSKYSTKGDTLNTVNADFQGDIQVIEKTVNYNAKVIDFMFHLDFLILHSKFLPGRRSKYAYCSLGD